MVHLDQTVLHVKPIHNLTKALQGPSLTVHDQLSLILTVASQLLQRIGLSLDINPKKYATDLKKNSRGVVVPMVFSPVNKKLFCSNGLIVQSALYSLEKHVEQSMIESWNKQIALQLQVLLKRFQRFLVSPLTKNCHIVFMQLSEIESPTKIDRLANFFGLVSVDVLDEFAAAKLCMNGNLSLRECFEKSLLQQL